MLKKWEKRGKHRLTRAAARALRARGEAGDVPDLAGVRRILLIRNQNQLGDMLLSTPSFRVARARAPEARIDLIAAPQNAAAVHHNRHLNEVLVYDKAALLRRPAEAARFLRRLREARYDLVIVQSTVSFSYTSAWLAAASRAERRAGRPGPGGRGLRSPGTCTTGCSRSRWRSVTRPPSTWTCWSRSGRYRTAGRRRSS